MAPEYATRRAMTVKVDVFSFGILLLEIVSGKNNADSTGDENSVFLLDTVRARYSFSLIKLFVKITKIKYPLQCFILKNGKRRIYH
jgi:hypothetical protein